MGLAGWSLGALSPGGAVAAGLVGGTVLARGGLPAAGALVAFFVTSSALGRYKARAKARRGVLAQAKGGRRDAWQVLANGGAGAVALALGGRRGAPAFLGALATAGADTWATELGLLASGPPRLVTTLRPVAPGTSGAVTPQGTLAAVGGALTVGATWGVVQALERKLAPQRTREVLAGGGGAPGRGGRHRRGLRRLLAGGHRPGRLLVPHLPGAPGGGPAPPLRGPGDPGAGLAVADQRRRQRPGHRRRGRPGGDPRPGVTADVGRQPPRQAPALPEE